MWSCTKCSYAYNHSWLKKCDICDIPRENSQNVAQPQPPTNLIQVTKIGDTVAPSIESKKELKTVAKISQSKSSHVFDEVPSVVQVPMASFEQDLEDDFVFHSSEWFSLFVLIFSRFVCVCVCPLVKCAWGALCALLNLKGLKIYFKD